MSLNKFKKTYFKVPYYVFIFTPKCDIDLSEINVGIFAFTAWRFQRMSEVQESQ